ncbi:MAG: DUF1848 domain-containing protein [Spirochaetales bacterium]|nr:DUF1848 domain-containing protein [Spirochaetales bacterium]
MIIHTGNRTDIPAFYSKWFINRIKAGFVLVRNPYNPQAVTRFRLDPSVVDLIAFCTKNPAPMLPHMKLLKPFGQYWFVTITAYGKDIEPNVPLKEKVMEDFKRLSEIVGVDSMGWRYDPILIDEKHTVEWHLSHFEQMAKNLSGYTKTCVISFIDLYKKVERNFPEAIEVSAENRLLLGKECIRISAENGMIIKPCAEGTDLAAFGADCSGCMTQATFETALHAHLNIPKGTGTQRKGACACILGSDIGAYDTCGHLCKYCYANTDARLVMENMKKHNPDSPFLLGDLMPEDVIRNAEQFSWIDRQQFLF